MLRLIVLATLGLFALSWSHQEIDHDKFKVFLEVAEKVLDHDKKFDLQEEKIATLTAQLQAAKAIIDTLNNTQSHVLKDESKSPVLSYAANTYTRWGRSTCPGNATLVYKGFAAGSYYGHKGAAANHLCLPKDPNWGNHTQMPAAVASIYGGEYETKGGSIFNTLHNHDVPCAVCRVTRTNIIMVPGKNVCYLNYDLEYKGYLMAGHYSQHATEYVCVDGEAEKAKNSSATDQNGVLFYFVRAKCGSLKCPPYKENDDFTCAVCSYSP